ncbi:MAG: hypothetical protein GC179_00430 [Anaerolineaceae bacterium]|nr:hypothetical protein [Anaerolineaceae bacterium]
MGRRLLFLWAVISSVGLLLVLGQFPLTAQDIVFATNTPSVGVPIFATNTPVSSTASSGRPTAAPLVLATNTPQSQMMNAAPDAAADRYALRRWDDNNLTLAWMDQVRHITAGDSEHILSLQLFQYEIARRFPGTPKSAANREALLQAMLAAPLGTVDLRPVLRPFVEDALNSLKPSFNIPSIAPASIDYHNFRIIIRAANLNGQSGNGAVVIATYLPDNGSPAFRDVAMAFVDAQGIYHVPQSQSPYPVIGTTVSSSTLVDNLNGDGINELTLTVKVPDEVNNRFYIYGWRNGTVTNLVEPGKQVFYLGTPETLPDGSGFTVEEYRIEDPVWNCFGSRTVTWSWQNNFFRPPTTMPDFAPRNTVACRLSAVEPLYALSPTDALRTIGNLTAQAGPDDAEAAGRAAVMAAMLNVLDNKPDIALQQIDQLSTGTEPGTWLDEQVQAFKKAAAQPNTTPLVICAALQAASEHGACDVNSVLTRLFKEMPFNREQSIEAQASALGLRVVEQTTIHKVGRVDRPAYHFDLAGNQWWAFAPIGKEQYTAEAIATPIGFELPIPALPTVLTPPQTAYDALLERDNPAEVLNILDTLQRNRPGTPLDSAARFLQALSYDLLADRRHAQPAYYSLWYDDATSVWGQLAAAHLERR